MRVRRQYRRFIRRLEVEFYSVDKHYRGISSNFSLGGLFVRTNHAFAPGTMIDLKVHLPDGRIADLKGRVKMAVKTPVVSLKNGMGVEILKRDPLFVDFVKSLSAEEPLTEGRGAPVELPGRSAGIAGNLHSLEDFIITMCTDCGAKNRVRKSRISESLICGKCGASLKPPA